MRPCVSPDSKLRIIENCECRLPIHKFAFDAKALRMMMAMANEWQKRTRAIRINSIELQFVRRSLHFTVLFSWSQWSLHRCASLFQTFDAFALVFRSNWTHWLHKQGPRYATHCRIPMLQTDEFDTIFSNDPSDSQCEIAQYSIWLFIIYYWNFEISRDTKFGINSLHVQLTFFAFCCMSSKSGN